MTMLQSPPPAAWITQLPADAASDATLDAKRFADAVQGLARCWQDARAHPHKTQPWVSLLSMCVDFTDAYIRGHTYAEHHHHHNVHSGCIAPKLPLHVKILRLQPQPFLTLCSLIHVTLPRGCVVVVVGCVFGHTFVSHFAHYHNHTVQQHALTPQTAYPHMLFALKTLPARKAHSKHPQVDWCTFLSKLLHHSRNVLSNVEGFTLPWKPLYEIVQGIPEKLQHTIVGMLMCVWGWVGMCMLICVYACV